MTDDAHTMVDDSHSMTDGLHILTEESKSSDVECQGRECKLKSKHGSLTVSLALPSTLPYVTTYSYQAATDRKTPIVQNDDI
jgi:hypothetical protein